MNLPSDSDDSDTDFVPDEKHCSEDEDLESDEVEEDAEDGESETNAKGKKRSARNGKTKNGKHKKLKKDISKNDDECDLNNSKTNEKSAEDVKKQEDDLWASFLKPSASNVCGDDSSSSNNLNNETAKSDSDVVKKSQESVSTETVKKTNAPQVPIRKKPIFGSGSGGGLSSVLNKIGKNSKLSTLEKSKMDWNTFKKDEGLEEEISIHNRGRDGYLERQDFLQRTDLRQFEIEKNLRTGKRGNR